MYTVHVLLGGCCWFWSVRVCVCVVCISNTVSVRIFVYNSLWTVFIVYVVEECFMFCIMHLECVHLFHSKFRPNRSCTHTPLTSPHITPPVKHTHTHTHALNTRSYGFTQRALRTSSPWLMTNHCRRFRTLTYHNSYCATSDPSHPIKWVSVCVYACVCLCEGVRLMCVYYIII